MMSKLFHCQLQEIIAMRLKKFQPKAADVQGCFNRSATAVDFNRINRTPTEPGRIKFKV